jgi:predicted peptidase
MRTIRYAIHIAALLALLSADASAQGGRGDIGRGGRGGDPTVLGRGARGGGADDTGARGRGGRGNEDAARLVKRSYRMPETGEEMQYDLFVSSKVDRNKPAPLIIFLHGLNTPAARLMPMLVDEAQKRGYIVAGPMGYRLDGWYGISGAFGPNVSPPNLADLSEKDVMHVLDEVRREFSIDERRIYLLGQSMGGAGVLNLGPKYKEIWAAIGASAPALRRTQNSAILETISSMPVILIHGDADRAVPVEQTRSWVDKMKALGMTHEYHEIRGGTHGDGIPRGAKWIFEFFDKHPKGLNDGAGGRVPVNQPPPLTH